MRAKMLAVLALGLWLAACGAPEEAAVESVPPADQGAPVNELVGQGEAMAENLCASCHAIGPTGESPHPEALPLRQLSWRYPVEDLAEPLSEGIVVGHPDMPEWQFEPRHVDALIAYLESIQAPRET